MVATDIKSTAALRPIHAADIWLTIVENELRMRPKQIAARRVPATPDAASATSHNGSAHTLTPLKAFSYQASVGERLQQDLSLEASPLSPYLDRLVDELRKQDEMIA